MRRKLIIVFALMLVLVCAAFAVCPINPECPIHDGWTGIFKGNRMVDGVMVGVYHCPRGHDFVIRCN